MLLHTTPWHYDSFVLTYLRLLAPLVLSEILWGRCVGAGGAWRWGVTVNWGLEGPGPCVGSAARWPDTVRRDDKLRCSSEATTSWPVANSSSMLAAPLPPRPDSMGHQAPRTTTSALSSSPSAGPTGKRVTNAF